MIQTYPAPPTYGYGITDQSFSNPTASGSLLSTIGKSLPLVGGILSGLSAKRAQKRAEAFAQKQMDFQERMSSTAYQRAAADLEAAGLNRILALGKPASSPSGAMPPTINEGELAINSALALRRQNADIKLIEAQARNVQADTRLKGATEFRTDHMTQGQMLTNLKTQVETKNINVIEQLNRLKIPGLQAEADFWAWLSSAELQELAKAVPLVGPGLAGIIRSFAAFRRRRGR